MVGLRKNAGNTEQKEGELCQEQKDRPGERHVEQDVLRVARDEELRVRYVARVAELREASGAQHARLPAVFGALVAGSARLKGLLSVDWQHLKLALRRARRPEV